MTWTDQDGQIIPSSDSGSTGRVVRHEINVAVVGANTMSFSCLTDFDYVLDPAPVGNEANNTLDYRYMYSSGDIVLHSKFGTMKFYGIYSVCNGVIQNSRLQNFPSLVV